MKTEIATLYTPFEKHLNAEKPWDIYPRPQFKRQSFINLNGIWNLEIKRKNSSVFKGEIIVPFPLESRLSGVSFKKETNDLLIYSKAFEFTPTEARALLNFGAVDQECKVYINGNFVGKNIGGYLPFFFDITSDLKQGKNEIKVEVTDKLNLDLAYGKQRKKRGGMWYTETSGIWQTVWIEEVPKKYIKDIKVIPDLTGFDITVLGGEDKKIIEMDGKKYSFCGESTRIEIENPINWTPENPHLYDFILISGEDEIKSYTALRTVKVEGNEILLNEKPYFFHGL